MREIKFRGKRVDNGEWVFGYYSVEQTNHGIWSRHESEFSKWYQVHDESVGQFISEQDADGQPIFDGDILKAEWRDKEAEETYSAVVIVKFKDCAFVITPANNPNEDYPIYDIKINEMVKLGDVFSNPELLK